MAGMSIVFFPKYSTLVANPATVQPFFSDPYDLSNYCVLAGTVNLSVITGGGSAAAIFESSCDLVSWDPVGTPTALTAGEDTQIGVGPGPRYVRLRIDVTAVGAICIAVVYARGVARECM